MRARGCAIRSSRIERGRRVNGQRFGLMGCASGGSALNTLPSASPSERASVGSSRCCAMRAAATSAQASSALNISGGSRKPAPSR